MTTIELQRGMQVTRDEDGKVRQLSHPLKGFRGSSASLAGAADATAPPSARAVAEAYLLDRNNLLELPLPDPAAFAAESDAVPPLGDELKFQEETELTGTATVSYSQVKNDIPVWNAGLTVRLRVNPMEVTGAHNQFHYDVGDVSIPDDAPYLPEKLTSVLFAALFPPGAFPSRPKFNADPKPLIYKYKEKDRVDPTSVETSQPHGLERGPPSLPLYALADIEEGRHYLVSEVLFAIPLSTRGEPHPLAEWGELNWHAFVEVETGSILYLRALVACAVGKVFKSDPVTLAGNGMSVNSPLPQLDGLRTDVPLHLPHPPGPSGRKALVGEFVQMVDDGGPVHAPPQESSPHNFFYSANTMDFAAVNAFHHCESVFRLIDSLGIPLATYFDGTKFPVAVDHFAMGSVNAMAPGNALRTGSGGFRFGRAANGSNFGIASDVRVVLHEFGHAILWDHVGSPNFGFAHSPGDSMAAILHDPGSKAPDRFDTFPFMRVSNGISRRHNRDVREGWAWGGPEPQNDTQYGSEQILSTTLFRAYQACGGDDDNPAVKEWASLYVTSLILKGVGLLRFTTTDPGVYAAALMESDLATAEFQGRAGAFAHKVIRWSFEQQGLYQLPGAPSPVFSAGAPPEVDIYIDDEERHGHYLPYLNQPPGTSAVWNRHVTDGHLDSTHQAPVPNVDNFLYIEVSNRGLFDALDVEVTAFAATAPTLMWPGDWRPLGTERPNLSVATGGSVIFGPIRWVPGNGPQTILVSAGTEDDASNLAHITRPIAAMHLVSTDNNLSLREM